MYTYIMLHCSEASNSNSWSHLVMFDFNDLIISTHLVEVLSRQFLAFEQMATALFVRSLKKA